LVITGSSLTAVEEFKEEMKRTFLMSDLGLLSFYLSIEVRQDARGITLKQSCQKDEDGGHDELHGIRSNLFSLSFAC
jgi:hypothetical protein